MGKEVTFVSILGMYKSGSSLVTAILDAHKDAVIADEFKLPKEYRKGLSWEACEKAIINRSQKTAKRKLWGTNIELSISNQYQGNTQDYKVIGVKHGEDFKFSTWERDKTKLNNYLDWVGLESKFIHIVRNPFYSISAFCAQRTYRDGVRDDLTPYIDKYFHRYENMMWTIESVPSVLIIKYEELVTNPKLVLSYICSYLGLSCYDSYLEDCANLITIKPDRRIKHLPWNDKNINYVYQKAEKFSLLGNYKYD